VPHTGILRVLHVPSRGAEGLSHLARFFHWDDGVGVAVENPDRSLADAECSFGVGVGDFGVVCEAGLDIRVRGVRPDAATNRDIGGEAAGVASGDVPGAIAPPEIPVR
jgi:hypothetical protein